MDPNISATNHTSSTTSRSQANEGAVYMGQSASEVFVEFVLPGVILNVTGLLGLVGNVMSIVILRYSILYVYSSLILWERVYVNYIYGRYLTCSCFSAALK